MRTSRAESAEQRARAAVVAVLLCGAFASPLSAQRRAELMRLVNRTVSGTVTSVTDGDSVRIRLDGTTHTIPVRLEGIDAPESGEPFSNQARNAARVLMFDKKVQVMARDVDTYDRLVARVIVAGTDTSLELIQSGLACHFTRFENDSQLANGQLDARKAGRGFWAEGAEKPRCVKFTKTR